MLLCVADSSNRPSVCLCNAPDRVRTWAETADGADVVKETERVAVCFTVRKTETDVSIGAAASVSTMNKQKHPHSWRRAAAAVMMK